MALLNIPCPSATIYPFNGGYWYVCGRYRSMSYGTAVAAEKAIEARFAPDDIKVEKNETPPWTVPFVK